MIARLLTVFLVLLAVFELLNPGVQGEAATQEAVVVARQGGELVDHVGTGATDNDR